jgi:hypothetical protein
MLTSTPRCAGFPLVVTSSPPGIPAPRPVTNRPWAPSTRRHPLTATGTRSGTSPACQTQSCSGVSSTLQNTGSAAPTTPAPGATTPCGSAVSSSPTTQPTQPARWAPATGKSRLPQGSLHVWPRGQALLPGPTPTRSWPRPASSRLSWQRSTGRCGCSAPQWRGKPPRAVNARGSWADRPATASTPTTLTRLHGQVKSSSPPRRCCGPCRHPRPLRRGTCNARCRLSSSKRPSSRPKARPHVSASRGCARRRGCSGGRTLGPRRRSCGASRQLGTRSGQGAAP